MIFRIKGLEKSGKIDPDSPLLANIVILSLFIGLGSFFIIRGYGPIHDAISWHGVFHYFYSCVEKGQFPFWNPYSQTGTPFYVYYQPFGLLEPLNFFFILIQKITGCTTFSTYILSYLSYYYLFTLGAYYLLREIIKSGRTSLLFSLVLCLGTFPMFMRQNGALNSFFLAPFILYFISLFLKEPDKKRKSLYFIVASYLLALSFNINFPSQIMFAVSTFLVFSFIFKSGLLGETIVFFKTRKGLVSAVLSLLLVISISLPVFALYYDFQNNNEEFPSVRILQKNGNNLVKLFVSDIDQNLFSEKFTNNSKVSENLWNLAGLVYEPALHFWGNVLPSENFMYISILPLLCGVIAFRRKDNNVLTFGMMACLALMLMVNFSTGIISQPAISQRIIFSVDPFMRRVEVLENLAPFFLLCAVIVGAIGFETVQENKRGRLILNSAIAVILFKLVIFAAAIYMFIKNISFLGKIYKLTLGPVLLSISILPERWTGMHVLLLMLIGTSFTAFMLHKFNKNTSQARLLKFSMLLLFLDLAIFAVFHANHFKIHHGLPYEYEVKNKYYSVLKKDGILKTQREKEFIDYREPFTYSPLFSKYPASFMTFWGHEVYSATKTAFPAVTRLHFFDGKAPSWDHFYMTKYYYDYLVNIDLDKQLITSGIISPILNYYPREDVVLAKDKYEIVNRINESSLEYLGTHVFIEKNENVHSTTPDVSSFFNPNNYLGHDNQAIVRFAENMKQRLPRNSGAAYNIEYFDVNRLLLILEARRDGYFYFGDGYSKYWKAFIDGASTKIYKTNINFKSIYVPAGKHKVEFIYDPRIFRYSLYGYFLGNLIAVCCIAFLYYRCRKEEVRT